VRVLASSLCVFQQVKCRSFRARTRLASSLCVGRLLISFTSFISIRTNQPTNQPSGHPNWAVFISLDISLAPVFFRVWIKGLSAAPRRGLSYQQTRPSRECFDARVTGASKSVTAVGGHLLDATLFCNTAYEGNRKGLPLLLRWQPQGIAPTNRWESYLILAPNLNGNFI